MCSDYPTSMRTLHARPANGSLGGQLVLGTVQHWSRFRSEFQWKFSSAVNGQSGRSTCLQSLRCISRKLGTFGATSHWMGWWHRSMTLGFEWTGSFLGFWRGATALSVPPFSPISFGCPSMSTAPKWGPCSGPQHGYYCWKIFHTLCSMWKKLLFWERF